MRKTKKAARGPVARTKRPRASAAPKSKTATQYTKVLLKKGAKAVEQGIDVVGQGAETLGNVILRPFRSS